MAKIYPSWSNIERLTVKPTEGELYLLKKIDESLDESYEVFFNAFLDGDRPDIVIVKRGYGAIIIEVKDWSINNYVVTKDNKWLIKDSVIRSPQTQVFRYKQNMFELHLPILGLKELVNRNFYNVIGTYVYFNCASKLEIKELYQTPENEVRMELNLLNASIKNREIVHFEYDKKQKYLSNKIKQISRDACISYGKDNINDLVSKIKRMRKNNLFTNEIYLDFIRRLSPPTHILDQGLPIVFDRKQESLINSVSEKRKVKGVAGCGKTSILAKRAISAFERHGSEVLILTYNITLRHYIRDKISQIQCKGAGNQFEIMHYHGFINNKLNEYGLDVAPLLEKYQGTDKEKLEKLYKDRKLFESLPITEKYKTIFIDEVQDYEPDWIKIIRDCFLEPNGEMILFGDQSQNIYERDDNKRESALVQGFGRWFKLSKSYRSEIDTPLIQLFKGFQEEFLVSKYSDSDVFESNYIQGSMNFDLLAYESYGSIINTEKVIDLINSYVKEKSINPNDIAIICSKVEPLIAIEKKIRSIEKTKIMFEDADDLRQIEHITGKERVNRIEKIRRRKKCFFMQNSGVIKMSTTHSFKGLESDTVFCILLNDDHEEMVYTGITRARKNLVIFDCYDSRYKVFFSSNINS
ncbi:UvrD-helicase domain-containing protein [Vibrio campbellii]|uniref:nuclease-related domain-containing DEAD/DEAH box helicase n=1 Tax=Vibrio campbellii TaxID=680 RepID=UPI00385766A4